VTTTALSNKTSSLSLYLLIALLLFIIAGVAVLIDGGLFFLVLIAYALGASLFSIWRIISSLVGVSEDDNTLETEAVRKRKELVARRDIKLKIVDELKFDHDLGRISDDDFNVMYGPVARDLIQADVSVQREEVEHRNLVETELARRLRAEGISTHKDEGASTNISGPPEANKASKNKEKAKQTRTAVCASCAQDIDPDSTFCKHCGNRQTGKSGDA
jgi:hypothetical protein